jgi:anti-sigma regulatory factor (Ser/Thr protein kinase)
MAPPVPNGLLVKLRERRIASFEPTLEDVVAARRFACRVVADAGHAHAVSAVALATGELAANAVEHAGTAFEVVVIVSDVVRIEVADGSDQLPVRLDVEPDALSGRGVMLVDLIGSAWGVVVEPAGKRIWVEIDL